jgi:hypothetical protein
MREAVPRMCVRSEVAGARGSLLAKREVSAGAGDTFCNSAVSASMSPPGPEASRLMCLATANGRAHRLVRQHVSSE